MLLLSSNFVEIDTSSLVIPGSLQSLHLKPPSLVRSVPTLFPVRQCTIVTLPHNVQSICKQRPDVNVMTSLSEAGFIRYGMCFI
jgi:hypothetical protein